MGFFAKLTKQFHKEDPARLKRELLWLWSRACRYRGKILTVGVLSLAGTIMGLASGVAIKYLIDAVTGYGAQLLGKAAVIMAVMMLGSLALQGLSSRIGATIIVRVKNEMQHATFGPNKTCTRDQIVTFLYRAMA